MTTSDQRWIGFIPRDTVFLRTSRRVDDDAATAHMIVPGPTTIAGATGTALAGEPREVRGPVLGRLSHDVWTTYFPVPLDVVADGPDEKALVSRLHPTPVSAITDLEDAPESWLMPPDEESAVEPIHGVIPVDILTEYLAGRLPKEGTLRRDLDVEDPIQPEIHVGLTRRDDRQVRTGHLYTAMHSRLKDGWGFLAECIGSGHLDLAPRPVQLGGRGRLADVTAAHGAGWPDPPERFEEGKVLVYLATPAIWPAGWRLPLPEHARLIAAATGEAQQVVTLTPGPDWHKERVLRWAVPPGSVYLLQFNSEAAARQWATKVHGTAYGRDELDRLRTAGFGIVLTGVWS